jgi:transposase-like protein
MKQKRYNKEFKETIVELYRSGSSVTDLHDGKEGLTHQLILQKFRRKTFV